MSDKDTGVGNHGELAKALRSSVFPIVGVGASAGGLEALSELFSCLPVKTGMAYVLIQHLDPTHPSQLTDLLSRVTKMPVCEATDGMAVEPDHLYVIPPNANLATFDGVLSITPRVRGHHSPIDFFLQSLSRSRRNMAIGVVLSGAGSDGTLGLRAIKAEGGITFAQDKESAVYASMPHSAIASGNVDFVLPPEGIARELARIARDPYVMEAKEGEEAETEGATAEGATEAPELGKFFAALRTATGVDFGHYKRTTILRRIRRRMLVHRMDKLSDFHTYLKSNPGEVAALYQDLLINCYGVFPES
jgi:two-component system CheB/CheR fusion protein